jgi:hypothetical protein
LPHLGGVGPSLAQKVESALRAEALATFTSLKKSCRELGVNFWADLQDRVRGVGRIPRLAELIRRAAEEAAARKAAAALPAEAGGGAVG